MLGRESPAPPAHRLTLVRSTGAVVCSQYPQSRLPGRTECQPELRAEPNFRNGTRPLPGIFYPFRTQMKTRRRVSQLDAGSSFKSLKRRGLLEEDHLACFAGTRCHE